MEESDFFFKARIWYTNYKRFVLLLIPFFLLALGVIFKSSLNKSHIGQEALVIKHAYNQWEKAKSDEKSHFQTFIRFLKKRPELLIPYEAQIVQRLLSIGKTEQLEPLAHHVLKRALERVPPYYTEFAQTTLQIDCAQEKPVQLHKALEAALVLKEEMLSDKQFWEGQKTQSCGSMLFAFNLFRIAILSQSLGLQEEELVAWREFKRYASGQESSEVDKKAFEQLAKHLAQSGIPLQDYIKHREDILLVGKV